MPILMGEDVLNEMKADLHQGVRIAKVTKVNLTYDQSSQDQKIQANQLEYGTVDLQFLDFSGEQKQILIPTLQWGKSSGSIDIPENNAFALCIFMPNSKAVVLNIFSMGDDSKQFLYLRDFVASGILPQLQEGDHINWSGNKAFHFVRTCTKKITQTIGKLLDSTKNAVQINGKDVHYNLEHETGTKFSFDQDGNLIVKLASNQKMYINKDGSTATDADALVTKAFITQKFNSFITSIYNTHIHPVTTAPGATGPTTSVGTPVSTAMPDGVSTPDIRVKGA